MPDMASTFFTPVAHLHGPFLRGPHTETERQPAGRKRDWAMGSQPVLEGGQPQPSFPQNRAGAPAPRPSQSPRGSGMFCQQAGPPRGCRAGGVGAGRAYLLCVLLLHGLEVGAQVHGHLVLEYSRARSMASAETRTRAAAGALELPRRSSTLSFRSLICREQVAQGSGRAPGTPVTTTTSWTDTCVPSDVAGTGVGGSRTGNRRMCRLEAPFGV